MGLEWNWRESGPCNLLIGRRLSADYTLLKSSISEKRPSSCDICAPVLGCIVCGHGHAVLFVLSCSFRFGVVAFGRNCARASCTNWCGDTCGLCAHQWFGLGDECTRLSFERSGTVLCVDPPASVCNPLPIVVRDVLVVAEPCAWAGARRVAWCTARLRFELRYQSAPSCAHCCVRMRIRCTRLPIPVATRLCTRSANF